MRDKEKTDRPIKVAVLSSSGGSAAAASWDLLRNLGLHDRYEFRVYVDRPCDFEKLCSKHAVPCFPLYSTTNKEFSLRTKNDWETKDWIPEVAVLFLSRLVTKEVHEFVPTINFHPSLLPAYPGFGALTRALEDGVRFLGATAHIADQTVDGGPILLQTIHPISPDTDLGQARRIAFVQKTVLLMRLLEVLVLTHGKTSSPMIDRVRECEGLYTGRTNPDFVQTNWKETIDSFVAKNLPRDGRNDL